MASLSEILTEIGDDNLKAQFLRDCILECRKSKTHDYVEVTFATSEITPNDFFEGKGMHALVVWLEKDEFNSAVKKLNAKS